MKFSYAGFEVEVPYSNEPVTVYRPIVPLLVHGPTRSLSLRALLDTGADYCVFSATVARQCGVELDEDRRLTVDGVGSGELEIMPGRVTLEVADEQQQKYAWEAEVYFGEEDGLPLCQVGCLEHFLATFHYGEKQVELISAANVLTS